LVDRPGRHPSPAHTFPSVEETRSDQMTVKAASAPTDSPKARLEGDLKETASSFDRGPSPRAGHDRGPCRRRPGRQERHHHRREQPECRGRSEQQRRMSEPSDTSGALAAPDKSGSAQPEQLPGANARQGRISHSGLRDEGYVGSETSAEHSHLKLEPERRKAPPFFFWLRKLHDLLGVEAHVALERLACFDASHADNRARP